MASPMPAAPMGNWGGNGQARPPPPPAGSAETEENGVQVKTMGLKVTYAFADSGESFLARHPDLLTVQTVPIDEKTTVGMVDLKLCAQAVVKCSPELLSDATRDFAVYAYDYSEPDEPLVGQGFLGWIINNTDGKRIIGRTTRNPLSVFSGGVKEILEIKLKLKPVAAMMQPKYEAEPRPDHRHSYQRSESHTSIELQPTRPNDGALTPTSHAEWNALMQSNPQMGNQHQPQRVASPHHPPQNHNDFHQQQQPPPQQQHLQRSNSFAYNGLPPQQQHKAQLQQILPQPPTQNSEGPNRVAPTPVDTATETQVNPPSRPSSRASNTSKRASRATGRPRGRPRKQPRAESQGNTSGYEDGTDGDDGPAKKKRATMTQVTGNINAPFGGGPGPLRVTASTAGSLRTLRPAGVPQDASMGSHMQDVPRAPTPVPERGPSVPQAGKATKGSKLRRQSTLSQAATPPSQPQFSEPPFALSPSQQDGRSPDSEAVSPNFSEDSPAAIGSSPPVPRTTSFVRSSPPASSPILPPMRMPMPQPDSGFMSGGVDDLFDGDVLKPLPKPVTTAPAPAPARRTNRNITKERMNRSGIPIQVFQLVAQPSSEADNASKVPQQLVAHPPTSAPSTESSLPALQHSVSDPNMTVTPQQPAGKEPSPQQEEPVVVIKPDVDMDSQSAPIADAPRSEDSLDVRLEHLVQAVQGDAPDLALPEPPTVAPIAAEVFALPSAPPSLSRSTSSGFSLALPTVPASDPVGPIALPALPLPDATSFSEAPCPPSDAFQPPRSPPQASKSNKNYVKKQAIREKLLQAIESGQTPMYCNNCGAIETPTWRKIWSQEHEGVPEFAEFSDKPGRITAILVLERDDDEKVTKHQIIKKGLAPGEDKSQWKEHMLCNPCGIWLSKWKAHRPSEKWEKDRSRLSQQRRPRGAGRAPRAPRVKKSDSANPLNPTSEAYFTDPIGPEDRGISPIEESRSRGISQVSNINEASQRSVSQLSMSQPPDCQGSRPASPGNASNPGSTHSRGSGTAKSPITLDNTDVQDMGGTRRLLFPSPRKEGVAKVLGEVAVNIVQTAPELDASAQVAQNKDLADKSSSKDEARKEIGSNKENLAIPDDDLEDLFRSPIARPSTPPPRERPANNGPFKTPTRPTPSHRPITRSVTRSVSRSLRSGDLLRSPMATRRTPMRTPRSAKGQIRRSPRLHHEEFSQMELALEEYLQTQPVDHQYDSDMLEAMNRALAESMNAPGSSFDITSMMLDSDCQLEFGDLLDSPSKPTPRHARQTNDYEDWETWEKNMRERQAADDA
ncbi:GATA transcription factor [Colletotrichum orchidophilum]|uniref:GATA transcription factor n=1 Tax=Colletotrichum orchidophilum TaxID=1209926 RepID=A0A1G4B640_9PEZI|nr:GATA transcription factor [Colletotrichum orchidophilum]OHE96745.1 GATA transcription factor [Colletotrichum orchidophilum]